MFLLGTIMWVSCFRLWVAGLHNWSVGPRRPSDQSDAIVAGCLYM